jgi:hypothetical protein
MQDEASHRLKKGQGGLEGIRRPWEGGREEGRKDGRRGGRDKGREEGKEGRAMKATGSESRVN